MMLKQKICCSVVGLVLIVAAPFVQAAEEESSAQDQANKESMVQLGMGLVGYGTQNEDAMSIANGVRLLNRADGAVMKQGSDEEVDRMALLEDARGYAGDDELVAAFLDQVQLETEEAGKWGRRCWYEWVCNYWNQCWWEYYCSYY